MREAIGAPRSAALASEIGHELAPALVDVDERTRTVLRAVGRDLDYAGAIARAEAALAPARRA